MRRLVAPALVAVLFVGCAGSPPRPSSSSTQHINTRIHMQGAVYSLDLTRTVDTWNVTMDIPAARVWSLLPDVYQELGLQDAGRLDGEARVFAFNGRMPRVDGRRRSVFLRCGRGMTGDFADEYDVRLFVRTSVQEEAGDRASVATTVDASAVPRGVSGGAIPCTSTGELERTIAEALLRAAVQ